jgi:hypothetical protein
MSLITQYYVYKHINPTDNKIFYIGMGNGNRAKQINGRSKFWTNVYKKHGRIVEIIMDGLTKDEAHAIEKFYIQLLGRRNEGTGNLVNLGEGGESIWNCGLEAEKQPRYGCKNLDKQKEAVRDYMLKNNPMKNTETINKMVNSKTGIKWKENHSRLKKIEVFKNGEFIGEFSRIQEVCDVFKLKYNSVIKVLNNERKSLFKYKINYKKI